MEKRKFVVVSPLWDRDVKFSELLKFRDGEKFFHVAKVSENNSDISRYIRCSSRFNTLIGSNVVEGNWCDSFIRLKIRGLSNTFNKNKSVSDYISG